MSASAGIWGQELVDTDDAMLLGMVRDGDADAYAELWRRHLPAAYAVAHRHRGRTPAEDVVAEASTRVYSLIVTGKGPTTNFRSYFLSTVKTVAVDYARTELRVVPTEDASLEAAVPTVEAFDVASAVDYELVRAAFGRLPERDQRVLWYTAVEGTSPAKVAGQLGLSANGVRVTALRARDSLRANYLDAHADRAIARAEDDECRWVLSSMGRFVRGKLPVGQKARVEDHLRGCRHAQVLASEMTEANRALSALMVPLILLSASSSAPGWAFVSAVTASTQVEGPRGELKATETLSGLAANLAAKAAALVVGVALGVGYVASPNRIGDGDRDEVVVVTGNSTTADAAGASTIAPSDAPATDGPAGSDAGESTGAKAASVGVTSNPVSTPAGPQLVSPPSGRPSSTTTTRSTSPARPSATGPSSSSTSAGPGVTIPDTGGAVAPTSGTSTSSPSSTSRPSTVTPVQVITVGPEAYWGQPFPVGVRTASGGDAGLSPGDVGLSPGDVGLSPGDVGLSPGDVGLSPGSLAVAVDRGEWTCETVSDLVECFGTGPTSLTVTATAPSGSPQERAASRPLAADSTLFITVVEADGTRTTEAVRLRDPATSIPTSSPTSPTTAVPTTSLPIDEIVVPQTGWWDEPFDVALTLPDVGVRSVSVMITRGTASVEVASEANWNCVDTDTQVWCAGIGSVVLTVTPIAPEDPEAIPDARIVFGVIGPDVVGQQAIVPIENWAGADDGE